MIIKSFILISIIIVNSQSICIIDEKSNLFVQDIAGRVFDLVTLSNNDNTAIILYSDFNCYDCLKKVIECIDSLNVENILKCIVVRCENNNIVKRKIINRIKYVTTNYPVFFDIHKDNDPWPPCNLKDGIFGLFKVCRTPSIIATNKYKMQFLSFEKMNNIDFSKDSIIRILKNFYYAE